ncbi:hypothetical protein QE152_g5368 [Popillia japonica]|uniref:Uncharacterized protein n=1 Tax=Popillia japonica TaxID=7064 RepID=A0AAW1MIP0_POPJA
MLTQTDQNDFGKPCTLQKKNGDCMKSKTMRIIGIQPNKTVISLIPSVCLKSKTMRIIGIQPNKTVISLIPSVCFGLFEIDPNGFPFSRNRPKWNRTTPAAAVGNIFFSSFSGKDTITLAFKSEKEWITKRDVILGRNVVIELDRREGKNEPVAWGGNGGVNWANDEEKRKGAKVEKGIGRGYRDGDQMRYTMVIIEQTHWFHQGIKKFLVELG